MNSRTIKITLQRGRDTISLKGNNSVELEGVYNKGPLLTTAMALFGGGSFLAARIANPSAYQGAKMVTNYTSETSSPSNAAACADFAPMGRLFGNADSIGHSVDQWCLRNEDGGGGDDNSQSLSEYMGEWVLHFNASSDIGLQKLSNTFNTAAFLANQAFVLHNSNSKYFRKLEIYQDPGEDALVPTISFAGIIIVSACLGAHLLGLLLLALYATFSPRWTDKLDAFAMMRIGAAMAQKTPLPLAVGKEMDKIGILDEHPGRIGGSAEEVGQAIVPLELGGPGPINGKSIYLAYAGDSDVPEREAQMRHRAKAAEFRAIAARQRAALAETTRQEV
jgi:hypothetical protein